MKRLPKRLQVILDQMEPGKWYKPGHFGVCMEAKLERLVMKGRIKTEDGGYTLNVR